MYELSGHWQTGRLWQPHTRPTGVSRTPQWMIAYLAEQQWVGVPEAVIRGHMEAAVRRADAKRALARAIPLGTQVLRFLQIDPRPIRNVQVQQVFHQSKKAAEATTLALFRQGLVRRTRARQGGFWWYALAAEGA